MPLEDPSSGSPIRFQCNPSSVEYSAYRKSNPASMSYQAFAVRVALGTPVRSMLRVNVVLRSSALLVHQALLPENGVA